MKLVVLYIITHQISLEQLFYPYFIAYMSQPTSHVFQATSTDYQVGLKVTDQIDLKLPFFHENSSLQKSHVMNAHSKLAKEQQININKAEKLGAVSSLIISCTM